MPKCQGIVLLRSYHRRRSVELGAPLTANTKVPQGYANGVTYDANYIYLACGSYGLVVLDKNNMENGKPVKVVKKRAEAGMSANYVTLMVAISMWHMVRADSV